MIKASIIGATGYTGGELLEYLARHPRVQIKHCTSESCAGKSLFSVHEYLAGRPAGGLENIVFEKLSVDAVSANSDVVFLCLPHGKSAAAAEKFLRKKVKVIDLSADFRLHSAALYEKWYGVKHPCPGLLKDAIYGLPEINRKKISGADLVANPGCYATAITLGLMPLAKDLLKPGSVIADAKSGVSGAGKKLEPMYHFCQANENFLAYSVDKHRHSPEIEQTLSILAGAKVSITFVPHLLPVNRGILATIYVDLRRKISPETLWKTYARFYEDEPFVVLLPDGNFPDIKSVQRSNFCRIGVRMDERHNRAVIVSAIDNLGKGASSQAVQNMNLMFHLDETCGLL